MTQEQYQKRRAALLHTIGRNRHSITITREKLKELDQRWKQAQERRL